MTAYVLERKEYWKYGTGTEPNVAIVGSPTISNAVASGFTSNSYLKIGNFNPQNNPWEAVFKFTVANVTAYQYLIGVVASGFAININGWNFTNSKLRMSLSSTSSSYDMGEIVGVTTLVNGNTYWVKLLFTGSQYQLLLSDNAAFENATVECSVDSTKVISPWNDTLLGGVLENGVNSRPWQGSIDLTQSYIKINNKIWWYGTKAVKSTKDNYDFTTGKAYVLKRKRPKEYRKKVIDTATAGTYTFDVAKDTTARIILVGGGGAGGQVWEGHAEGSGGGSGACVYCAVKLTAGTYTITNGAAGVFPRGNAGNSTLSLGDTALITAGGGTGGWDSGGPVGVGGTYSFADSVEIEKIFFASNGNNGVVGGNIWGGIGGASVYKGYGAGGNSRTGGNAGYIWVELTTDESDYDYKIDNDACYVLKRKQYWKYGTEPNVTVVGSPTIDKGVASGFSTSNCLDAPAFAPAANTWEFNTKVRFSSLGDEPTIWSSIANGYGVLSILDPSAKFSLYVSSNGSSWNISSNQDGTYTLQVNTDYYVKIGWNGTEYYLEYSLDGVGYIRDITVASTVPVYQNTTNMRFGYWGDATYDSPNMIQDLNNTYININGERWWNGVKAIKATKDDYDFITD